MPNAELVELGTSDDEHNMQESSGDENYMQESESEADPFDYLILNPAPARQPMRPMLTLIDLDNSPDDACCEFGLAPSSARPVRVSRYELVGR